jgi:hypothetical protein
VGGKNVFAGERSALHAFGGFEDEIVGAVASRPLVINIPMTRDQQTLNTFRSKAGALPG